MLESFEYSIPMLTFESVQRFLQLPSSEKLLFMEAWRELLRAALLIRRSTPDLGRSVMSSQDPNTSTLDPIRIQQIVNSAANHHLKSMACLERAIALTRMLKRRGFSAELCVGVKPGNAFEAHAWVTSPYIPPDPLNEQFQVLRAIDDVRRARWA